MKITVEGQNYRFELAEKDKLFHVGANNVYKAKETVLYLFGEMIDEEIEKMLNGYCEVRDKLK